MGPNDGKNHLGVPGLNASFNSNNSRRRSQSQFSPNKSRLDSYNGQEKQHLMPKPSPRKLGKARDIEDSPDREQSQIERSFVEGLDDV